jgi:two-component system response regulator DevR
MSLNEERTKIFLAHPQVLFREGIHFILSGEADLEVTGEAINNEEAFSLIETNPPDVAILGMDDIKTGGAVITGRIRRNMPSVFVILIADKKEPESVFNALKSGASACLTKDTAPEQLLNTIRIVAQGSLPIIEEMFNPDISSLTLNEFEDSDAINKQFDDLLATLTPHEKQILNLIAASSNMEQIAAKTGTEEDNVRHNMRIILTKLIVNEQTRSIIEAAQRNMPSLVRPGKNLKVDNYITKAEFNEFRDTLMEQLKSFVGEFTPEPQGEKVKRR